jgi:hypothetical protein
VVPLVLIVSSLVFGIAVGRWWALVAAIPVGIAVGLTAEIEIPGRYLGPGYWSGRGGRHRRGSAGSPADYRAATLIGTELV